MFQIKILIPKIFVAKLIGAKGCMIQEIASSSGGAIIKILADKKDTRNSEEDTVVAVIGSQTVVFDALTKIIEQIEYFKNGGPVLNSGKAIFLSIPEQFRNSIILRNGVISKLGADNPSLGDPMFDQLQNHMNSNNYYASNKNQHQHQQQQGGFQQQNRSGNYNIKRESPMQMRRRSRTRSRSLSKGDNKRKYSDERKFDKRPIRTANVRGGRDMLPRDLNIRDRREEQFDSHDDRRHQQREQPRDNRDRRSSRDHRDTYLRQTNQGTGGYRNDRDIRDIGRNEYFRGGRDLFDNSFNNLPNNINFNQGNQRRDSPDKRNLDRDRRDVRDQRDTRDMRDMRDTRDTRDTQRERFGNNNNVHKEPMTTISYLDNGLQKIATSIIVPDNLVSLLIGKNGDNIKSLMSKCGCLISFAKEVSSFFLNYI